MAKSKPLDARADFQTGLYLTMGLFREPVKIGCPDCGKIIMSTMEWVCGYCDAENNLTNIYSFLNKCETCKQPPKGVLCPHCDSLVVLIQSKDMRHPAKKIRPLKEPESDEATRARKARQREDTKVELEHEILMTRLNGDLGKLKISIQQSLEPPKVKTALDKLEQSFSEHDARVMAAHRIAKRELEANKVRYADDPDLLQRADESVNDWLQNQIR